MSDAGGTKYRKQCARIVHRATGATYTICRRRVDHFLETFGHIGLERYLDRCQALPAEARGTEEHPLCINCLQPFTAGHACAAIGRRVG